MKKHKLKADENKIIQIIPNDLDISKEWERQVTGQLKIITCKIDSVDGVLINKKI